MFVVNITLMFGCMLGGFGKSKTKDTYIVTPSNISTDVDKVSNRGADIFLAMRREANYHKNTTPQFSLSVEDLAHL